MLDIYIDTSKVDHQYTSNLGGVYTSNVGSVYKSSNVYTSNIEHADMSKLTTLDDMSNVVSSILSSKVRCVNNSDIASVYKSKVVNVSIKKKQPPLD